MKRFRYIWLCTAGIVFLWLLYFVLGTPVSRHLAARFAEAVLRATRGNVADPAIFIRGRLCEGLLLATLLVVAAWLHIAITQIILRKSANRSRHWIAHAVSGFVLFNLWLGLAMQTTLFWCAMWQGEATQNLTRFHLKRLLLAENQSPSKAVILGNSQSRAQIDEELLNKILELKLHTAELHFPGSNAYDVWLIHRKIAHLHPNLIIVYISEATFYNGNHHDAAANFFQFSDVKDLASRDVRAFVPRQGFQYGLLGAALPIFRLRDVLSQRILGTSLVQLKQQQHNQQFLENLESNAKKMAPSYRIDASSAFEKRAFTEFISDCETGKENVLVLVGQLNPLLGQRFDSRIRADMISLLRQLRDKHPNMALIENLPFQSPSDYEDLTHVKKETQSEFTQLIAEYLKRPFAELRKSVSAGSGEKFQIQN
jgi:hypothetical protein